MRLWTFFVFAAVCAAQDTQASRDWLNRGVQAYKSARYRDAVDAFRKAVELDPNSLAPHQYLAAAYLQQYIPGQESPENRAIAEVAETEFRTMLSLDPSNRQATASLGQLYLTQKKWEDARTAFRQLITLDPKSAEAYYSLAFIDWSEWYPAFAAARTRAGLRPEDPGPIGYLEIRASLGSQWRSTVEDGIWNLNRALELQPQYSDAMAYMNLFVRERADLKDTRQEYLQDIAEADGWVQRALAAKRNQQPAFSSAAPPPPPPPPAPPQSGSASEPRLRIAGDAAQQNLVSQTPPVYPPLARQAQIQGTVKLGAVIGRDGNILNLSVISGHPLLVPAAMEAVRQWQYRPTMLNGQPVEVATEIHVNFTLQ